MNAANLKAYHSDGIVSWYDRLRQLVPAETAFFERMAGRMSQCAVLDIGIGGGRTTGYLAPRCRQYTGIDYSQPFVELCQKKYPHCDLRLMDATNLSAFETNSFDLVVFSLNGLDYVGLKEREQILSGICRVLKPGGIFFFSTHNKAHHSFNRSPWLDSSLKPGIRIKTFLRLLPFYPRHLSLKKKEEHGEQHAVINDWAHDYSLLTFYTTPAFLREQLNRQGFCAITFHAADGRPEADDRLGNWIFATCEKQA